MTYCSYESYEALVQRAVRDHRRSGRAGGGDWVVTIQASTPGGTLREPLRAGYGAWLRATAVTGLAGALLAPAAAVASPLDAPGLPAKDPQAVRPSGLEIPAVGRDLLQKITPSAPEGHSHRNGTGDQPQAAAQLDPQPGTPVSPLRKPPPARQPAAKAPTAVTSPLAEADSKPLLRPSLGASPAEEARSAPRPPRVDAQQSLRQHPGEPSAPPERAKAARPQPVAPDRIDQWATTVQAAIRKTPKSEAGPALVTLAEVSPTPKMGWSYRVQPGDTLWRISTQLWSGNSSSGSDLDRTWRVLYEWNRDTLGADSNRLYPGQVLEIPADSPHVTTTSSGPVDTSRQR